MTRAAPSALEELFPALRGRRVPLGEWPTPVAALDVGSGRTLWVKEEGRSARPYGGNKVRKLEWLLGGLADGPGSAVTFGAVGSHHVLATAVYAGRVGVRVHAVLVPQPETTTVRRNAAVTARLVHRVWPASGEVSAAGAFARAAANARGEDGAWPRIVWVGGSSPKGVLGWVDGGLEIACQVANGDLPQLRHIVVPAGTGGMAAGLLIGTALGGLEATVHAVRVAEPMWSNRLAVRALVGATSRVLARHGCVPHVDLGRLRFRRRWLGQGYGHPTAAGAQVTELARSAGVHVEPTYTAKALAAAVALARSPRLDGEVLWISSSNAWPLEDVVGGPVGEPPAELLRLMRATPGGSRR